MGKISIVTKKQELILKAFQSNDFLKKNFYFTGGTALSLFYLQHRQSIDLDFFTQKEVNSQVIIRIVDEWSRKYNFKYSSEFIEKIYIFHFNFPGKQKLKVDFAHYPYSRLKKGLKKQGMDVDSQFDIAVNKLMVVTQRENVKDFIDLYFLLKKFTFWDLFRGVDSKFKQRFEPTIIASDFLKVEEFDFLPKMVKSLDLEELKKYYRNLAIKIGGRGVRK